MISEPFTLDVFIDPFSVLAKGNVITVLKFAGNVNNKSDGGDCDCAITGIESVNTVTNKANINPFIIRILRPILYYIIVYIIFGDKASVW